MGYSNIFVHSFVSVVHFWAFWGFFESLFSESSGKNARPRVPLDQSAHGAAGVRRRLRRSWHQIPRLLRRLVAVAWSATHPGRSHEDLTVPSPTGSATARHLHSSGVSGVCQQAWGKITVYTKQGFRYDLRINCVGCWNRSQIFWTLCECDSTLLCQESVLSFQVQCVPVQSLSTAWWNTSGVQDCKNLLINYFYCFVILATIII